MNNRPTPETDNVAQPSSLLQYETVNANFARKLERERDDAREDLEFRRGLYRVQEEYLESEKNTRNTIIAKGLELKKQLDEAREALKHIEEYGTEEINAAVELRQKLAQALVDLDNMQDQRDLAMKVIKRLERERDEAREERDKLKQLLSADAENVDAYLGVCIERDEAMEQVKELIYIADRAIDLAEIDFENDKFGVVSELKDGLKKIKEASK